MVGTFDKRFHAELTADTKNSKRNIIIMQYNEAKMSKKINEHNKIKTAKMTTKPFCQQQYVIFEYGI